MLYNACSLREPIHIFLNMSGSCVSCHAQLLLAYTDSKNLFNRFKVLDCTILMIMPYLLQIFKESAINRCLNHCRSDRLEYSETCFCLMMHSVDLICYCMCWILITACLRKMFDLWVGINWQIYIILISYYDLTCSSF